MIEKLAFISNKKTKGLNVSTLVIISLTVTAFMLSLGLTTSLEGIGVFNQRDVFFDTDPNTRLLAMTEGMHPGIKHPNFSAYTTPPVAICARLLRWGGFLEKDDKDIRRSLGLLVNPIATALKVLALCFMLKALGFSTGRLSLVVSLFVLSPSNLIFGSFPETYGLAGLSLVLAFLLATRPLPPPSPALRIVAWVALGVFAMGVTITNVFLVGILFWSVERMRWGVVRAAVHGALLIGLVTALTGVSSYVYDTVCPSPINPRLDAPSSLPQRAAGVYTLSRDSQAEFEPDNRIDSIKRFPGAVVDTILPAGVAAIPREAGPHENPRFTVGFTFEGTRDWRWRGVLSSILVLGVMGIGVVTAIRQGSILSSLAIGSLLILVYNWMLHTVFGVEFFLYSQHWHLPVVLLMASVMIGKRGERWRIALFAVCVVAVLVNDVILGQRLLEGLSEGRSHAGV